MDRYRICRLAEVESGTIRKIGVGRHHDDPGERDPWEKRGVIFVQMADGEERLHPVPTVAEALQIFSWVLAATQPGQGYYAWVEMWHPKADGEWYWYADGGG